MSLGGHVGSSCTGERCFLSHNPYWLFVVLLSGFDGIFSLKHGFSCLALIAYLCGDYISICLMDVLIG
jgi:hypothetical protein